jgi:hypothetical protein
MITDRVNGVLTPSPAFRLVGQSTVELDTFRVKANP